MTETALHKKFTDAMLNQTTYREASIKGVVTKQACFLKFCIIYWKKSVLESFFDKIAVLQPSNFIKERLQTGAFL